MKIQVGTLGPSLRKAMPIWRLLPGSFRLRLPFGRVLRAFWGDLG